MHHTIRQTTALFAVLGALGMAHAEGGPGDSGVGGNGSVSSAAATGHPSTSPKQGGHKGLASHKAKTAANRASDSASGPVGQ